MLAAVGAVAASISALLGDRFVPDCQHPQSKNSHCRLWQRCCAMQQPVWSPCANVRDYVVGGLRQDGVVHAVVGLDSDAAASRCYDASCYASNKWAGHRGACMHRTGVDTCVSASMPGFAGSNFAAACAHTRQGYQRIMWHTELGRGDWQISAHCG
jgi:hypothetical protein